MSCCRHAEGLKEKGNNVGIFLLGLGGQSKSSLLLLPFGTLSQGKHHLGSLLTYTGVCQEELLELQAGQYHNLLSLLSVLLERDSLTGKFGEFPVLLGSSEVEGWLVSAV